MSDKEMNLAIENKLQHTIDDVSFMIKSIVAFDSVDTLYLGMSSSHAAVATNSLGNIYLLMPAVYEDRGYSIDTRYVPFDIDVLEERANERTNKPTEDVIPAKVDNVTTEEKECATEDKTEQTDFKRDITSKIIICGIPSYKDSAPAKDVAETKVDSPDAPNAPANVVQLDKPSNKFSFDAIGVNVGDKLTFVDGTEVIAAENNKIIFCGELFTLSGFCKEFMPDDKRTKSNSYRGCAFFFKDGVKLEKLFKDAQKKSLVSSKEEIAAVPDDTLDSVPNEHLASEKCTEQTITPPTKENVSERKETASTAKVVAISIGVPVCLDIPPNNMRFDIASNKPLNAVVGDCLCGVGKVVHTLPLPPPRSKGMSELITYTNFYNTS